MSDQSKTVQHLEYPELTMFQMVENMSKQFPDTAAIEFYGKKITYTEFMERIDRCAKAFVGIGIKKGDAVTLCMPNIPQCLECFYALNRIGAVANMVHPLSAPSEITFFLDLSESKAIVTVDIFFENVSKAIKNSDHDVTCIITRMQEELPLHLAALYLLKKGKSYLKYPNTENSLLYTKFIKGGEKETLPEITFEKDRTAVILYSGGTSGIPKGICLTDLNFNACAMQAMTSIDAELKRGMKMLSCMPMFHGFGLGINIHTVLIYGFTCVLLPTFTKDSYANALIKIKPNFIAGVPTIFEALLHIEQFNGVDLSFLKGMFCGGDSLSVELKKSIDTFLK